MSANAAVSTITKGIIHKAELTVKPLGSAT